MKSLTQITSIFLVFVMAVSCTETQTTTVNAEESEAAAEQKANEDKMVATTEAVFEAWNTGDSSIIIASTAENFSRKQNGEKNMESTKEYIEMMNFFRTAIPDINFSYDIVVVDGNKTYSKWAAVGNNTGNFGDQPPTGKSNTTHGFTILTFNDAGKITQEEAYMDQLSYLEDWGYTITPPEAE